MTKKNEKPDQAPVKYAERSDDVPVTQGMLYLVRDEPKAENRSFRRKLDSIDRKLGSNDQKFDSIDKRFLSVDGRFLSIDRRFDDIDKRFDSVDKRFDGVFKELHEMKILIEEQNNRNKYVMDALISLFTRQDRVEKRVDDVEQVLFNINIK